MNKRIKIERIGEEKYNNENCLMRIVEYNNYNDITIEFQDKYKAKVHSRYQHFKSGLIKNPYHKSVYGVGYIGEGNYTSIICGKTTIQYAIWCSIMQRCYDKKTQEKYPTYKDCEVNEEWHDFQNFAKWYDDNYYEIDNEQMNIDKDILVKGNKIYSPETCIFVPHRINSLFVKCDKSRGELPIGVDKNRNSFRVQLSRIVDDSNIQRYLGTYTTKEEAFEVYKKAKEDYIKEVAEEYREKIPQKLYNAMCNYKVEIDD